MKRNIVVLFVIFIFLTGCTVTGPKYSTMQASISSIPNGKGRILFFRDDSFVGGGVRPDILLNGAAIGESLPGGFFYVDRDPGTYKVSTSTEVERTLEFTLQRGERKYIKTSVSMGFFVGHVRPELVSPSEAETAMQNLSMAGKYDPNKPKE